MSKQLTKNSLVNFTGALDSLNVDLPVEARATKVGRGAKRLHIVRQIFVIEWKIPTCW